MSGVRNVSAGASRCGGLLRPPSRDGHGGPEAALISRLATTAPCATPSEEAPVRVVLARGLHAAASAGQPLARGASGNALARRVLGRAVRGGPTPAPAGGGQVVRHGVGARGRWKRPFEIPSMLPLLSSPLPYFFFRAFSRRCVTLPRVVGQRSLAPRPRVSNTLPPVRVQHCHDRLTCSHCRDARDNLSLTMCKRERSPPVSDG